MYYIGQELSKKKITVRKQIEEINAVTKEQIVELAKSLQINTIYFLTGENNDDSEIFEDD